MLRSMSWSQVKEWIAFDQLEPFGDIRGDYRTAHIVSTLLNVNRKRGSKRFSIKDAMLRFGDSTGERKPQMDWRHMKALAKMAAAAYNSEIDAKEARARSRAAVRAGKRR